MNDNHLRARRDSREPVRHRVLPAFASLDHDHVVKIGRRACRELGWERDDHFVERIALQERLDGALENGHARKRLELLGLRAAEARYTQSRAQVQAAQIALKQARAAEARAAAAGGDDRGDARSHECDSSLVGGWWLVAGGWLIPNDKPLTTNQSSRLAAAGELLHPLGRRVRDAREPGNVDLARRKHHEQRTRRRSRNHRPG